jgi:hypothetical protein
VTRTTFLLALPLVFATFLMVAVATSYLVGA